MKKLLCFVSLFLAVLVLSVAGSARAVELKVYWDPNTESNLDGYTVYISSSYARAQALDGDLGVYTVSGRSSTCVQVSDGERYVFAVVVARDTSGGVSSPSNITYWLKGNVYGTENVGVSYADAIVNGQDIGTITSPANFGKSVTHQSIDCSLDFYSIITGTPQTTLQRCDLNKNGRVDGVDLMICGANYGNFPQ